MSNTYTYIRIHTTIHTHTYTYTSSPITVGRGYSGAVAVARDSTYRHYLPRSSQTGLGAGSPSAKCVCNAYWRRRRCTLPPPDACCARWCAKTGLGECPRWRDKVVCHLPRDALSGAGRVPPQPGAFWRRCAGIGARLGQYIQYMQIQWTYMPKYITEYIHIHTHMHSWEEG